MMPLNWLVHYAMESKLSMEECMEDMGSNNTCNNVDLQDDKQENISGQMTNMEVMQDNIMTVVDFWVKSPRF